MFLCCASEAAVHAQVPRIGRSYVKPKDIAFTGEQLCQHSHLPVIDGSSPLVATHIPLLPLPCAIKAMNAC